MRCKDSYDKRRTYFYTSTHRHHDLTFNALSHGQPVQPLSHVIRYTCPTLGLPPISQATGFTQTVADSWEKSQACTNGITTVNHGSYENTHQGRSNSNCKWATYSANVMQMTEVTFDIHSSHALQRSVPGTRSHSYHAQQWKKETSGKHWWNTAS